jgi:lipoate---protein ligase
MDLYNLGKVPWLESQLIYHALALMEREALCLVSPATPYVCIGFHQDVEQEVDLAFCHANRIPVFRREVGGGAVFLDGHQLFFQLILKRDNPVVPKRIDLFYQKFLQPVIAVHHRIGINAAYKPVNDVIVANRKISGTGVGEIGNCIAFVGNLILDFDYTTMARVLKIPDEKFRDKVKKTIEENLSTIRRELGLDQASRWDEDRLNHMMAEEFAKLVGFLAPRDKDAALIAKMKELQGTMMQDEWLFRKGKRSDGRVIKIRAGLELIKRIHKAAGGLIRAEFTITEDRFRSVSISGDFFCFPKDTVERLAAAIEGEKVKDINQILNDFYTRADFELPGIQIDDWLQVFKVS